MSWLYVPASEASNSACNSPTIIADRLAMTSGAERQRLWRERHPEQSKSRCREYHARNRESVLDRKKQYYQDVRKAADQTSDGRLKDRNRKARRRSLSKSGHVTAEEWETILAAHDHRCAYCRTNDLALEMDHVTPLSKGGQHCATNIVPACKPCNSKKGAR